MSFTSAEFCTPGSCTLMRSSPWRCTIGSDTPSSLTRLRSVVMFCSMRVVLARLDLRRCHDCHDLRPVGAALAARSRVASTLLERLRAAREVGPGRECDANGSFRARCPEVNG